MNGIDKKDYEKIDLAKHIELICFRSTININTIEEANCTKPLHFEDVKHCKICKIDDQDVKVHQNMYKVWVKDFSDFRTIFIEKFKDEIKSADVIGLNYDTYNQVDYFEKFDLYRICFAISFGYKNKTN